MPKSWMLENDGSAAKYKRFRTAPVCMKSDWKAISTIML
jgi:hypothetical protein